VARRDADAAAAAGEGVTDGGVVSDVMRIANPTAWHPSFRLYIRILIRVN